VFFLQNAVSIEKSCLIGNIGEAAYGPLN